MSECTRSYSPPSIMAFKSAYRAGYAQAHHDEAHLLTWLCLLGGRLQGHLKPHRDKADCIQATRIMPAKGTSHLKPHVHCRQQLQLDHIIQNLSPHSVLLPNRLLISYELRPRATTHHDALVSRNRASKRRDVNPDMLGLDHHHQATIPQHKRDLFLPTRSPEPPIAAVRETIQDR